MRDPPADGPVGLERERLDLCLDQEVRESRGAEDRDQRRGRPVRPAKRAGPALEAVRVEAVLDDEQPRIIPDEARGLIVDRRGEADSPGSGRPVDPELGAAELVEVPGHERSEVLESATSL